MKKIIWLCVVGVVCVGLYYGAVAYEKGAEYAIDESLKGRVAKIIVEKQERVLSLYDERGEILKVYTPFALGQNPRGHKEFEGDGKTPEGIYRIDSKNPRSRYFLNLGISYPNQADKAHASMSGKSAGGDIKIHGLPNGMSIFGGLFALYGDWTDGCIALDNASMKELFEVVEVGTEIEILP